ncbi:MAG: hypothetical protein WCR86_05940 [Parabacteroides sp.]
MIFSTIYRPTALFSLRDSNSTNSGAKSLFLPSPYAIKMAFLSQAISIGGIDFEKYTNLFKIIRDADISYYISGNYCVNNCFVKIQKQRDKEPFKSTVSFREYMYIDGDLELIIDVESSEDITFLKKYLHTINYFGKRGCFFQFIEYKDIPSKPNVINFNSQTITTGIIQEFDDFDHSLSFEDVNSFSNSETTRKKMFLVMPLSNICSSKSYTHFKVME